jgi:hypothetical protein
MNKQKKVLKARSLFSNYKEIKRTLKSVGKLKDFISLQVKLRKILYLLRNLARSLKMSIAGLLLITGLHFEGLSSVTFSVQTGVNNPLDGVNTLAVSSPEAVDLDGDGDLDMYIGGSNYSNNWLDYYENQGSSTQSDYQLVADPFATNWLNNEYSINIAFVDIDDDGDFDAFSGNNYGDIRHFENTGSSTLATFAELTAGDNPLDIADNSHGSTTDVTLVDIDNDGDFDAFIGASSGTIIYYRNVGSASVPSFNLQSGNDDPFDGEDLGGNSTLEFFDVDDDGDYDFIGGNSAGNIIYYENTGSANSPEFTLRTGSNSPFNNVDIDVNTATNRTKVSMADYDSDGLAELFIGSQQADIIFYETSLLASELSPSIYNFTISDLITNSASFSADIADGGASTTVTFEYGFNSGDYSNTTSSQTISGASATVNVGLTETGLESGTFYYVVARAENSVSFSYSTESSFWTFDDEPDSHSSLAQVGEENTQIELSFDAFSTISDANGYIIIRSATAFGDNDLPSDGSSYEVDDTFGNATVVAKITDNTATSHTFTGLAKERSWQFAIVPYNEGANPATINYKTDDAPTVQGYTIPILGEWGMIVFGSLMLIGGVWYIRRVV